MTKRDLINYCLTLPSAYEDYPFDETTALVRHKLNKKMFALVDYLYGRLQITLKCEPFKADFLRQVYKNIVPGYHMNKLHWISLSLMDHTPESVCRELVDISHELVWKGLPKKMRSGGSA